MKKILLVNAARYFFDEGKSLLERKDFRVFHALSAAGAMEVHQQENVDLIVADFAISDMSGDVLCARLRENSETRLASFILVCSDNPAELLRAKQCGANICLKRPFSARTLLDHVEKMLSISVRRGYRVLLRAQVKGARDNATFFCTSQNISATGILIETDRAMEIGDQLTCSFYIPGSAQISAEGEVARTETMPDGKHQYGVRFTGLLPEQTREIEKFINESLKSAL